MKTKIILLMLTFALSNCTKKTDGTPALSKVPDTIVPPTIANNIKSEIHDIHWKLAEMNGVRVENEGEKDFFIEFKKDNTFSAFAGCNQMSGKYEFKENQVKLFNTIATMMACPDMKTEDGFKKALETTDNFIQIENMLELRKGEVSLLKFEAIPKEK